MKEMPEWFVWTTTIGLGVVIALLWLDYTALTGVRNAQYTMMQGNLDMNMMNGGMMKMMANAMMKNGIMSSEDYANVQKTYNAINSTNNYMGSMMQDQAISSGESEWMGKNHMDVNSMMQGMMK